MPHATDQGWSRRTCNTTVFTSFLRAPMDGSGVTLTMTEQQLLEKYKDRYFKLRSAGYTHTEAVTKLRSEDYYLTEANS